MAHTCDETVGFLRVGKNPGVFMPCSGEGIQTLGIIDKAKVFAHHFLHGYWNSSGPLPLLINNN